MIVVHRNPFVVLPRALSHINAKSEDLPPIKGDDRVFAGPMIEIALRFEKWHQAHWLEGAEAFLDTGADTTLICVEWLEEVGRHIDGGCVTSSPHPMLGLYNRLEKAVELRAGECEICMPGPSMVQLCSRSGRAGFEKMPGHEDVLIGRDVLRAHGVLLLFDFEGPGHTSLLCPCEPSHSDRRRRAIDALDLER